MEDSPLYTEKLSSPRTQSLFITLTAVFLLLFVWRLRVSDWSGLTLLYLILSGFFLFYILNFHTLHIRLAGPTLSLHFGIFIRNIQMDNIQEIYSDQTSLWRIGGAGIHYTPLKGKYRAYYNFLEHPRLVVALKQKYGLVQEVAFSTSQPDHLRDLIYTQIRS